MSARWPKQVLRRFMVGHHVFDYDQFTPPDDMPPILSKVDPVDFVRKLKKADVEAFYFYNKCHRGNAYYPSKVGHVHSALEGRDLFKEYVEACLAEGIIPLAVYEFSDMRLRVDKPEWCHKVPPLDKDVDVTDAQQGASIGGACLNGPYGEFAIEQALETVRNYPVQGYFIDFLGIFDFERWICPYCSKLLKEEIGLDWPGSVDRLSHEDRIRYIKWRYQKTNEYLIRMRDGIQQINPDCTFVHNFHGYSAHVGLQTWKDTSEKTDYISADLFTQRAGYLDISWLTRGFQRYSKNGPGEVLLDSITCIGGDYLTPKALDSYRGEIWTAMSNGNSVICSIVMNYDGTLDDEIFALTGEIFGETKKYEQWLRGTTNVANVALVRAQNTINFRPEEMMAKDKPESKVVFHSLDFDGWAQALIEEHVLWDVIIDYDLTDDTLSNFKVVILPDAACLSKEQAAALRRFVEGGGILIATGESSLFDEEGRSQGDFSLSQVLGVSYLGERDLSLWYVRLEDNLVRPKEKWVMDLLLFGVGQWRVKAKRGADVLGHICERSAEAQLANMVRETDLPGLVRNTYGKGTAYYFAGMPGVQYHMYGHLTSRMVMGRLVHKHADASAPVVVEAPATVEVMANEQRDRNRTMIHLVNMVCDVSRSTRPFRSDMNRRYGMTDKMPAVVDITLRIKLKRGKRPAIYRAPDRKQLRWTREGSRAVVKLDRVAVHETVVVEY